MGLSVITFCYKECSSWTESLSPKLKLSFVTFTFLMTEKVGMTVVSGCNIVFFRYSLASAFVNFFLLNLFNLT